MKIWSFSNSRYIIYNDFMMSAATMLNALIYNLLEMLHAGDLPVVGDNVVTGGELVVAGEPQVI